MSRLDQHVIAVQNRLTLELFLHALAKTLLIAAAAVLVAVGIDKAIGWHPPRIAWWIGAAAAVAAIAALAMAIRHRPDRMAAATAIDEKLGLHEKVSTALFARGSADPFAMAAVHDAEATAGNVAVHLGERFPLTFPKATYAVLLIALAAWMIAAFVTPMDLLGHKESQRKRLAQAQAQQQSRKQLEDALAVVNAVPPAMANEEKIKLARQDITAQLAKNANDPAQASRSAMKALQDVGQALQEQVKNNVQFAQAKADEKMWKQIGQQPITEPGPVNDVRRELADGKFSEAINDLSSVVNNFDKMDKQQQQQAAQQMKQLAQQLQHQGNPSATQQQQMQQQLQQMGLNQQQARQAQQLMQQAAAGNPQAQQQLQQMARQATAQMNNGQGPTAQQRQQAQQMMQQMQAAANNQAQAQQMAQAAQQMAQAMQQATQPQSGQQQSSQQQSGQQASAQHGQQQGQQQGQKSGQQAGQNGQQQGQQAGGSQQAMSGAMQQMQQQMQQMQAISGDAQQLAAAQQAVQNGMDGTAPDGMQPSPGDGAPGQQPNGNGARGQGGNGGGKGFGAKGVKAEAPYTVKPEFSPSEDNGVGKLLATSYVKAGTIKGESRAQLKDVAESAIKDPTDEIDQDRISRQAQSVVRKYFSSMEDDAAAAAPATTQP